MAFAVYHLETTQVLMSDRVSEEEFNKIRHGSDWEYEMAALDNMYLTAEEVKQDVWDNAHLEFSRADLAEFYEIETGGDKMEADDFHVGYLFHGLIDDQYQYASDYELRYWRIKEIEYVN